MFIEREPIPAIDIAICKAIYTGLAPPLLQLVYSIAHRHLPPHCYSSLDSILSFMEADELPHMNVRVHTFKNFSVHFIHRKTPVISPRAAVNFVILSGPAPIPS